MDRLLPRNLWKPVLIAAAIAFAYAGVLAGLGRLWWDDENYSHGLLIPFVIGYILWTERGRLAAEPKRPSFWWGGAAIVCGLFGLWVGTAGGRRVLWRAGRVVGVGGGGVGFFGGCA